MQHKSLVGPYKPWNFCDSLTYELTHRVDGVTRSRTMQFDGFDLKAAGTVDSQLAHSQTVFRSGKRGGGGFLGG